MKISLQSRSPWLENLENILRSDVVCGDGVSVIFPASFIVASSEFLQSVLPSCTSCSVSFTIYLPSLTAPTLKLLSQILIGGETEQLSGDDIAYCLANVEKAINLLGCTVELVTKLSSSKAVIHKDLNISTPAQEACLVKEELEIMVAVKELFSKSESNGCERVSAVVSKSPRSTSGNLDTFEGGDEVQEKGNCDIHENILIPQNAKSHVPASHELERNVTGSALPVSSVTGVPMLPIKPLAESELSNLQPCHPMPLIRLAKPLPTLQVASSPRLVPPEFQISNDNPHQRMCAFILKATYEPCPDKAMEQSMMYKQYLASIHKLGRIAVISVHYFHALCIRIFGPPISRIVGDKVENYYKGIQMRAKTLSMKQMLEHAARRVPVSKPRVLTVQVPRIALQQGRGSPTLQQVLTQAITHLPSSRGRIQLPSNTDRLSFLTGLVVSAPTPLAEFIETKQTC